MGQVLPTQHLGRRDLLVACWKFVPEAIGLLPPHAQWELHRLYAPSLELSDDEFLEHMRLVLEQEPSLAQRVGKHYRVIFTVYKRHADDVGKTNFAVIRDRIRREYATATIDPTLKRRLVIMPLVNPEIDHVRLARAFLQQVEREHRRSDRAA